MLKSAACALALAVGPLSGRDWGWKTRIKIPHQANVWLFFAAVYGAGALLFMPVLLSGEGMSSG